MDTTLKDFLIEKKPAILKRWFDVIMETYPTEAAGFLTGQKDRFTGPLGYTIHEGIDVLIDGLINEVSFEELAPSLESIIKVRAVQDFTPSEAVAFIFQLKIIVREELQKKGKAHGAIDAATLSTFESRIDTLALISFDIYIESREKIYDLKVKEVQDMVFRLVQRQNQLYEVKGQNPIIETPNLS